MQCLMFGNIQWNDADNVQRQILQIPAMVSRDEKYQNAMKNSDEQEARTESERALQKVIFSIMADNMELFKQFQDNPSFKKWLTNMVFNLTYNKEGKPYEAPDDLDSPKVASDNFTSNRYPTEAPRSGMMAADGKVTFGEKKDSDSKK
jgi:type I restriction enzyme R subunit